MNKTQLEQIEAIINNIDHELGYFDADHIPEVRKAAQQILDICQPQWIPVTERLPITESDMGDDNYKTVEVIACMKYGGVCSATFEAGNTVNYWSGFNGYAKDAIAHWMPLPEDTA